MNPKYLLFLLIPLFFAACDDDDDITPDLPLQIRLQNIDDGPYSNVSFGFLGAEQHDFGTIEGGATTDYRGYTTGGTCSYDLRFNCETEPDTDCNRFISACLCICTIEPGNYTLQFDLDADGQIRVVELLED